MRKTIFLTFLLLTITLLSSCAQRGYTPQAGDLLFQIAGPSEGSQAIADATAWDDAEKFSHVAILALDESGDPYVLEATGDRGVTRTEWADFVEKSVSINGKPGIVVKRVNVDFPVDKAFERIQAHYGEPYDWSYYPDNGKMYCSELVYECFRKTDGTPLFTAHPMNFRDGNGNMPAFWIEVFEKLGEPIPEGVLGTNPQDMSKDPVLVEVHRYF